MVSRTEFLLEDLLQHVVFLSRVQSILGHDYELLIVHEDSLVAVLVRVEKGKFVIRWEVVRVRSVTRLLQQLVPSIFPRVFLRNYFHTIK